MNEMWFTSGGTATAERGGMPGGVAECLKCLERIGSVIETPKNQILYSAGDLPENCYIIKKGRVISFEYTSGGRQRVFSNTGENEPDSFFLLPGVIIGHRLTLSFMTTMPSTLIKISRAELLDAMIKDPEIALAISYILAEKFVGVNERFHAESSGDVTWRLCNLLMSLAERCGVEHDGKVLIGQKYSQQMMADYLHVNRTTVARGIKELTEAGLIERVNDLYCIRSTGKMRSFMDGQKL